MTHHAGTRIIDQHTLQGLSRPLGSVGHDDHARMQGVTHADTAAMMEADPGSATGSI